jgi:hypothetical protein
MTKAPPPSFLVIGFLGLTAVIGAALIDVHALLVSYLAAVVTISAVAVGAIPVLMLTYLVRGNWTEGLHVPLMAAALITPAAGLLFIPVLIGIPWLYPWAQEIAGEPGSFKAIWLTPWFFAGRTILYFVIWTVLAIWVRSAWADPRRMIVSASAGLMIYALTASCAGIDWLESLTPEFHSSIYGLLFLTFQILAGFAFALVIALWQPEAPTFRYGAILLSALLLWAYNHAMQYIIIWSGNIPEEVAWYLHRESGAWGVVLWTLVALQFIVPFFAMLLSRVRNGRAALLAIAGLTLALRWVEACVLALPETQAAGTVLWLAAPGAIVVCGAIWWLAFKFVFEHVRSSPLDLRPLADAFDPSGSPILSGAPRS